MDKYVLSSNFSNTTLTCTSEIDERPAKNIKIVTNDYNVSKDDDIIIIDSKIPRVITLYRLTDKSNGYYKPIKIKSMKTVKTHRINVYGDDNLIDDVTQSLQLGSFQRVKLVPLGKIWYLL